jgi:hypothetical protein
LFLPCSVTAAAIAEPTNDGPHTCPKNEGRKMDWEIDCEWAGRRTPFTYYFASNSIGSSEGQLFLDDAEALHTIERGSFSILKLSCSAMDGGLSGNLSSLVLKRGYLPEFDPKIQHSLILEEIVIMGLDAHAL